MFTGPAYRNPRPSVAGAESINHVQWSDYLARTRRELERRLGDDPRLLNMMALSEVMPEDQVLRNLVLQNVDNIRRYTGACGNPFHLVCPPRGTLNAAPGKIALGRLLTGDSYWVAVLQLCLNAILVGGAGSGKSTILRALIAPLPANDFCIIVFVRDSEVARLESRPELYGRVVVLGLEDLKLVLFPSLPGLPQEAIDLTVIDLIARATGRMYAQRALLDILEALRKTYPGRGIDFDVLLDALQRKHVPGLRTGDMVESITMAIRSLRSGLGTTMNYQESDMLQKMASSACIYAVVLPTLPAEAYVFLLSYVAWFFKESRLRNLGTHHRPLILAFDDATMLVDRKMDDMAVGGTSPITEAALLSRKCRMGMVYVSHQLSSVSPKLVANCHLRIITSAVSENPQIVQPAMSLTPELLEYMRREMRPGSAVVHCASTDGWPQWVQVEGD